MHSQPRRSGIPAAPGRRQRHDGRGRRPGRPGRGPGPLRRRIPRLHRIRLRPRVRTVALRAAEDVALLHIATAGLPAEDHKPYSGRRRSACRHRTHPPPARGNRRLGGPRLPAPVHAPRPGGRDPRRPAGSCPGDLRRRHPHRLPPHRPPPGAGPRTRPSPAVTGQRRRTTVDGLPPGPPADLHRAGHRPPHRHRGPAARRPRRPLPQSPRRRPGPGSRRPHLPRIPRRRPLPSPPFPVTPSRRSAPSTRPPHGCRPARARRTGPSARTTSEALDSLAAAVRAFAAAPGTAAAVEAVAQWTPSPPTPVPGWRQRPASSTTPTATAPPPRSSAPSRGAATRSRDRRRNPLSPRRPHGDGPHPAHRRRPVDRTPASPARARFPKAPRPHSSTPTAPSRLPAATAPEPARPADPGADMPDADPTWVYTILACEQQDPHDNCARSGAGPVNTPTAPARTPSPAAGTFEHARVLRHPEGYPMHKTLAFEHRAGGGPCAACPDGRGPCADTPGGPLFLCPRCLAILDHELRQSLLALGLPDPGEQLSHPPGRLCRPDLYNDHPCVS